MNLVYCSTLQTPDLPYATVLLDVCMEIHQTVCIYVVKVCNESSVYGFINFHSNSNNYMCVDLIAIKYNSVFKYLQYLYLINYFFFISYCLIKHFTLITKVKM